MTHHDSTLPASPDDALLSAGFDTTGQSDALLREALGSHDPRTRVLAWRGAWRRGFLTMADWLEGLGDGDEDVVRDVLALVAESPVNDAVLERVVALLQHDDPLVVDAAAFCLGEHVYLPSVDGLVHVATHHDDIRCREAAVASLGSLGLDAGRPAILAALDDKPSVRRRAIVALANFEGPDIEAALAKSRDDRDWQVRAAVDQLGRSEE